MSTTKYGNDVTLSEDRDELLSSTDVDESLMGDDKQQWNAQRHGTRSDRLLAQFRKYRPVIDTSLLLVIAGMLAVLLLRDSHTWSSSGPSQVGGDFTGAGPKFPTRVVKWEANEAFVPSNASDFFSDETLATWKTLMPAGTSPGSAEHTFSTTSMTHQLHCLFMMGRMFSAVETNMTHVLPDDYHTHFLHCIDYMRQAVMCSADLSLELHSPSDGFDLGPLDGGWNGRHVCKDYSQVISYLEVQIKDGVRIVLPIDD